ncbi:MAG: hypothetical protein ACI9K9_001398 [Neolewinella sp.]
MEAEFLSRSKNSDDAAQDLETQVINLGVRWNVARQRYEF